VRLIALLSWWNEPLKNLEDCITSCAEVGVTHLVALDGPYGAVGDKPSSKGQAKHIRKVCERHGIECHVDQLIGATEPEKRTYLFALGYTFVTGTQDWFFVTDADTTLTNTTDLKAWLATITEDAATCLVYEHDPRFDERNQRRFIRSLFRCNPGLHVSERNHYTYLDGKGRVVWGLNEDVPAADCPVIMHNNSTSRTATRNKIRESYYMDRQALKLETHHPETCDLCNEQWTLRCSTDYKVQDLPDGTREVVSDKTAFRCPDHIEPVLAANRKACYVLSNGDAAAMDLMWQNVMLKGATTRQTA
jgi:hypothetical protein